jgi:SEL1 protein
LRTAISYFEQAAAKGHSTAQAALGFYYSTGFYVQRNVSLGLLHYIFASDGGDTLAQMSLGYKYMFGYGVPRSCDNAAIYYNLVAKAIVTERRETGMGLYAESARLSEEFETGRVRAEEDEDIVQFYQYNADTGDAEAQVAMGKLFLQGGFGVKPDYDTALKYFKLAMEQNHPAALTMLGFMAQYGYGLPVDYSDAMKHYLAAAHQGYSQAQVSLGDMYLEGKGAPQSYKEALKYYTAAADQGNQDAQLGLGIMYYNGYGVHKDYTKAYQYFTISAQQGNMEALYYLAQMQLLGLGVPRTCQSALQYLKKVAERGRATLLLKHAHEKYEEQNYEYAALLYEKAAELGYELAQSNAAWICDNHLTPQSEHSSRAFALYKHAAQQHNAGAALKLGDYYYYGWGIPVNYEKAVAYYRSASNLHNPQAMFNLGFMHQYGLGLPKDFHLAKRFYDMAAETSPDAYFPVLLALSSLGLHFVSEFGLDTLRTGDWITIQWDTALLIILTVMLLFTVILRSLRGL